MLNVTKQILLSLILILLLYCISYGNVEQSVITKYELIANQAGLSQNSVSTIFQDANGFIWVATADGLNRYDGYNFKIYKNIEHDSTSISNNFINTIFSSNDDKGFWVGTDVGLDFFDYQTGKFKRFLSGLSKRVIKGKNIDNNNLLLMINDNTVGDLYIFNKTSGSLKKIPKINNLTITSKMKTDFDGNIWLVTINNIYLFNKEKSTFVPQKLDFLQNNKILDFIFSPKGLNYISTGKQIYELDKNLKYVRLIELNDELTFIQSIVADKFGNLWMTDINNANIYSFNPSLNFYKSYISNNIELNLTKKIIKQIYCDKSGVIWIATDGNGVIRLNPNRKSFHLISNNPKDNNSLSVNFPKGILIDSDKNLWVTTINGGLNKYNPNMNKWEFYNNTNKGNYYIRDNIGFVVFEDSEKTIWYGGGNGIDTLNRITKKFERVLNESSTHVIFQDKKGYIWTGSINKLLSKFDKNTGKSISIKDLISDAGIVNSSNVYAIAQLDENYLWFGTDNGLFLLDLINYSIKRYSNDRTNKYSISNNFILTLLFDSQKRLWVGTRNGLNLFDYKTEKSYRFNIEDGLPNSFIYGILEDKNGDFWISTNNGLSRMRYKSHDDIEFRNYLPSDGLQANEFNTNSYYQSKNGHLFFGGVGGINYFHPDSLYENKNIPNVVITDISIFDISISKDINPVATKKITFPYYENTISFEFSALEFSDSQLNNYAYYMEGVDTAWVYSGNKRFARYPNLKPGKYVFKVKASNNDNIWNNKETEIIINIKAPFWDTLEFKLGLIILIILMVFSIYNIRTYQIRKRNIYLEEQISLRTKELMNKNIILENQSQEIIRINESLEKRVEERTQQLKDVNIKLQSLLDEITESKSDALKAMIKTQEDERSRFAKDLHDGAGQYLAFLKFNLYNISKKIPENQQDLKELLNEQIKLSDNIVKELRHFAYSLMPPVLERIGLKAAIEELLENYKASSKIKIEYYLQDKTRPLPKYYKIHLYRVVQEVVSNAFKHSDCSKISLQMLSYPNNLLIIIEDNGRGFNSKSDFKGMGLKNLISRIAIINGKIDIDSQLNHGTTITIEVPN